jgi:hypothetical protein
VGRLRRTALTLISEVSWRLPGWPRRLMTSFSHTEAGSAMDMLAAAERTERPDLRRKYFLHALDEARHAILFRTRAAELAGPARARADAAIDDAGYLREHGIVAGRTLFERLGELEFLTFVYVAEADAVEQFDVYRARRLPDPDTDRMLGRILKDEAFHVSYSRAELERYRREGRGREVTAAVWRVRGRRVWEAWLRSSRGMGAVVTSVWLVALYGLVLGPFRLVARLEPGGWQSPGSGSVAKATDRLAAVRAEA